MPGTPLLRQILRGCHATVFIWLLSAAPLPADPPPGYYDGVDPSSAAALRNSLHDLIDDHTFVRYTSTAVDTWDVLEAADEDPNDSGNILDVYKNASYVKVGGGTGDYNREHSWPKSYGFPEDSSTQINAAANSLSNYPYTDCHHLFLCDISYNSSRGNVPYRDCNAGCSEKPTDLNNGQGGGSGVYPGNSNWRTGSGSSGTWETWIGRRGDVARALFYMDVRYDGSAHSLHGADEPDLILTDDEGLILSDTSNNQSVAHMGMLADLLLWHLDDPVDDVERARNDAVFADQGNRNPFIDHPEWVDCVFNNICGGCSVPADCDDGDPCSDDDCVSGSCVHTPVDCDDADACTTDSCDSLSGLCDHTPISCDDGDGCTDDTCDPIAGCQHDPVACGPADGCCSAGCSAANDPDCPSCDNNGTCDAGEDCTTCPADCPSGAAAVCDNGVCEAGDGENCVNCPEDCNGQQSGKPSNRFCCGDGGGQNPLPCSDPVCSTSGWQCSDVPGSAFCCGDGFCDPGEDEANCPVDCAVSCSFDFECDDSNACTVDTCNGGLCANDPVDCDDGDACTIDGCDPASGCTHDAVDCDDGDPCSVDSCDPVGGCDNSFPACGASDGCCGPGCDPGNDPDCEVCGQSGDPCTDDSDCCSGKCKGNGTCK